LRRLRAVCGCAAFRALPGAGGCQRVPVLRGYALPITETGRSASWRRFQYTDADGRRVAVEVDIDPDGASYREIAVTRD